MPKTMGLFLMMQDSLPWHAKLPAQNTALLVLLLTAITLVAIVALVWLGLRHANEIKEFAKDFPTQGGSVVVALILIFFTGLTIIVRLALGTKFPDGYETWIWALIALAGVTTAGMVGKRATDREYAKAKFSGVTDPTTEATE